MKPHMHGCGDFVYKARTIMDRTVYLASYELPKGQGQWKFDVGMNRVIESTQEGSFVEHPCPKARKKQPAHHSSKSSTGN